MFGLNCLKPYACFAIRRWSRAIFATCKHDPDIALGHHSITQRPAGRLPMDELYRGIALHCVLTTFLLGMI